jgi:AcrR family transcriptional regulator
MRADAQRNRARLLGAARDAINDHGMDASMDDIARRAGVGPGTLYRHFPTREALLAAVYRDDVVNLAARADDLSEADPADALAAWLQLQLDHTKLKIGMGAALKAILGADSETLTFCRDTLRAAVGRLLDRAKAAGAVRTDVEAADVMRLIHGVSVASESAPDQATRLLGFVLDGLRPAEPSTVDS